MRNMEVATLKEQIDLEIEKGNYERAGDLSQKLCEIQGLDTDYKMPKLFILKIKIKERIEKLMDTKKFVTRIASFLLIIGVSGGVVYGATQYFRNVEHAEYGLTTGNGDITREDTDSNMRTQKLPENNNSVKVISREKASNNVLWIDKEVREETSIGYTSDDGIKWEEKAPNIIEVTEYSYKNYEDAIKDTTLKGYLQKYLNKVRILFILRIVTKRIV